MRTTVWLAGFFFKILEIRQLGLILVVNFLPKPPVDDHQVMAQVGTEVADSHLREHAAVPAACPSLPREQGQVSGTMARLDSATS